MTKPQKGPAVPQRGFPRKEPGTWVKPQRKGRERGFWVYIDSVTLQEANVDPEFPLDRIRVKRRATPIRKRNGQLRRRHSQTGVHLTIKFLKEGD